MDEIEKRLRETSETCFTSYEAWRKDQKNGAARETLQDAVHELRKVASRLEIELAVSERNEMAQKPIPIPPHRDATRRSGEAEDHFNREYPEDDNHNRQPSQNQNSGPSAMKRRMHRRPEGGGQRGGPQG